MVELELRGISKVFQSGAYALREVSFTAPAGQLTTLLGPSGSGKSTLLRIAAGLEMPSAGSVYLNGQDVSTLSLAERSITLLFQGDSLFPHLDVLHNVAFGLRQTGVPKKTALERARRSLELVGLGGMEVRHCAELSGGQQQRVALARALVIEPAVVLLDEPLSNLDDRLRRQMRDELRSLQQRLGLTMAYVTHDESEAMAVSDQVVIINEGRLLQVGSPRDVYERPNCEFVATFMGDATLHDAEVDDDGMPMLGAIPVHQFHRAYPPGARLRLVVRPEAWDIVPVGSSPGVAGRVKRCTYLGHGAEYAVETELGTLLASSRHVDALHQPGSPVDVGLGQRGVSVLSSSMDALPSSRQPA